LKISGEQLLIYYIVAFVACIFSEIVLAQYTRAFDSYNILGHLYKTAAFCLIYAGIFTSSVKAPYAKLVAASSQLQQDVLDLKRMDDEIRMHRDNLEGEVAQRTVRLEQLNKELESFSYSVSHDLRAPLRAIDGFSRMLLTKLNNRLEGDEIRKFEAIRESTRRMGKLIDDLLTFSRSTQQEMNKTCLDMTEIIRETWGELSAINPGRQMSLEIKTMPSSFGDRALVRQVYGNLLANAVKFTRGKDPTVIEAGSLNSNDDIIYYVKDNGIGFDMKFHDKLFGVFHRLHSEEEYEGTGIGLALVQRIVNRHGGKVWAQSVAGSGATFYFSLPWEECRGLA